MSEWKKVRLGEIGRVVGGATPSTKNPAYYDGDISWITPKDLAVHKAVWIRNGERSISEEGLKSCSAQLLPKGTILFSSRAPIGYVALAACELCTNQGFKSLIPNESLDSLFGYYLLVYNREQIENLGSGTTFKEVSGSTMRDVEISLPPLPTQRRIAAILSSLDDKIENNRKICANLEAQAQAIFKSWFVDFEPFGGKMPQGWKMGKLGDVIEVCYGKDHKALPEGNIPVFGSGGYMRSVDRCIYDEESVLIPRKGTLNNIMYVNEPFWTVDTMFYSKMREEHVAKYVHLLLQGKNMDEFNVGSAVPSMTTEILNNMEIIIPLTKTLQEFDGIASYFYAEVAHAKKQSRSLAAMRDALLPKLMSGEIDVEKVEVA